MSAEPRVRFCAACDPFFKYHRRDLQHTLDRGCKQARPGVPPRPWTEEERRAHTFVEAVAFRLEYPTDVAFFEAVMGETE